MSSQDPVVPTRVIDHSKPLAQFQEYLVAGKVAAVLLKELLVEIKELLVLITLIAFFVLGVVHAFSSLV